MSMSMRINVSLDSRMSLIKAFGESCAEQEGFYLTQDQCKTLKRAYPTLSQRNNNPLNLLLWGSFTRREGYVYFPKVDDGWRAARRFLERNIFERELTLWEFFIGQRDDLGNVTQGGFPGFAQLTAGDTLRSVEIPSVYMLNALSSLKEKLPQFDLYGRFGNQQLTPDSPICKFCKE